MSEANKIQDELVEVELLAHFLKDPRLVRASVLREDQFSNPANAAIFRALRGWENDTTISVFGLSNELERIGSRIDIDYIWNIKAVEPGTVDLVHVRELTNRIAQAASRVSAITRASRAMLDLQNPAVEYPESLARMASVVIQAQGEVLSSSSPEIESILTADHSNIFGQRFRLAPKAPARGILSTFNDVTRGMREGQVWNINAPYKSYKTRWVLNIILAALRHGVSVSYQTLEDNAGALSEKLLAILSGVHEQEIEIFLEGEGRLTDDQVRRVRQAQEYLRSLPLRIYDYRNGVHDHRTLRYRILSDRLTYGGDQGNLCVIDHINQFGDDNEVLGEVYRSLVPAAQEAKTVILGLSQQSNASIKDGTKNNFFAARGTGTAGMVIHFGLEVRYLPSKVEAVRWIDEEYLAYLQEKGFKNNGRLIPGKEHYLKEVGLHLKVLRRGEPTKFWGMFEPTSGLLVDVRSDSALDLSAWRGSGSNPQWDWETHGT